MVAIILADRATAVGREELQRSRVGGGRGNDRRVVHRAILLEGAHQLRHGRAFLSDHHIDAIELLRFVVALVGNPLVDDRIDGERALARLPVADDEFALSASDRHQRIQRLDSRLHRLADRLSRNDTRRLYIDAPSMRRRDRSLAVDRVAERIDDASQQGFSHRQIHDAARTLDRLPLLDIAVVAEQHHADGVDLQVERHALNARCKLDHLPRAHQVQPVDARNPVADRDNMPNL